MNLYHSYPLDRPLTRGVQSSHLQFLPPNHKSAHLQPSNPTLLAKFDALSVKDLDTYHLIVSIRKLLPWLNGQP